LVFAYKSSYLFIFLFGSKVQKYECDFLFNSEFSYVLGVRFASLFFFK